jgi:hypothetical protein
MLWCTEHHCGLPQLPLRHSRHVRIYRHLLLVQPSGLTRYLFRYPLLTSDELSALCTPECESTLNSVRNNITQSCAVDAIFFDDGILGGGFLGAFHAW